MSQLFAQQSFAIKWQHSCYTGRLSASSNVRFVLSFRATVSEQNKMEVRDENAFGRRIFQAILLMECLDDYEVPKTRERRFWTREWLTFLQVT